MKVIYNGEDVIDRIILSITDKPNVIINTFNKKCITSDEIKVIFDETSMSDVDILIQEARKKELTASEIDKKILNARIAYIMKYFNN